MLAAGVPEPEILADFPDLEAEDIRACLRYAARRADLARVAEFVSPRVSAPQVFRLDRQRTWPASAEPLVADTLASLAWWNMRARQAGDPDAASSWCSRSSRERGRWRC